MTPNGPSKTEILLSQFPGPVVVHRRGFYLRACLIGSLCFVLIGAFVLATEGSSVMAWGSTAFSAVCGIVLGFWLPPGSLSLTLDRTGFRVTSFLSGAPVGVAERIGHLRRVSYVASAVCPIQGRGAERLEAIHMAGATSGFHASLLGKLRIAGRRTRRVDAALATHGSELPCRPTRSSPRHRKLTSAFSAMLVTVASSGEAYCGASAKHRQKRHRPKRHHYSLAYLKH